MGFSEDTQLQLAEKETKILTITRSLNSIRDSLSFTFNDEIKGSFVIFILYSWTD